MAPFGTDQGLDKQHLLDLDDIICFPDAGHCPAQPALPTETWYILGELYQDESFGRPVYWMRTQDNARFIVAFYTERPAEDVRRLGIKMGSTIAIKIGLVHHFLDGRGGYRIEDASTVAVLPCSIKTLWRINGRLRERTERNLRFACDHCDADAQKDRCAVCRTPYCSREHQIEDWRGRHKAECKVIAQLRAWNVEDFDRKIRGKQGSVHTDTPFQARVGTTYFMPGQDTGEGRTVFH